VLFDETLRFLRVLLLLKINDRDISASLANAIATARPIPLSRSWWRVKFLARGANVFA